MPRSGPLTALVMLLIFGSMTAMAFGFPEQARMMPLLVGIPATLMALFQLVVELRKVPGAAVDTEALRASRRQVLHLFLWLVAFLLGVLSFGFLIGAPVLVAAFLRFSQGERWLVVLAGGVGAWLILYGIFVRLLELYLFEGHLTVLVFG